MCLERTSLAEVLSFLESTRFLSECIIEQPQFLPSSSGVEAHLIMASKKTRKPTTGVAQSTSVLQDARRAQTQDAAERAKSLGSPIVSAPTNDSFVNFQMKMGLGGDNPLTSSTYGFNPITRNRQLLEWIYRGAWVAGMAVDVVAQDMTRRGVSIASEMPEDDISKLERAATELNVWGDFCETIQWARLYGGAICVALIDGHDPREPLDISTIGLGAFRGLITLDRWQVEPSLEDLVTELGPDLGLPRFYRVTQNAPALRGKAIHHSRVVLRMVGVDLPYNQRLVENLWGQSVLERLYDRMVAFDSATMGAAQLVHKSYLRTLSVEGLRQNIAAGGPALDGVVKYVEMMRRFQGIEGMSMIDAKDKFEIQGTTAFSGLSDALTQFGQQLSGALEIPLVRMFGQSPSGFNSGDSDIRNYYDGIASKQANKLTTGVQRTYRMIAISKGIQVPPDFSLSFNSLWELSDKEKSEIAGSITDAIVKAQESGLISDRTAMQELRQSARKTGVFTNISQDDITLASNIITPPVPEIPGFPGEIATDPNGGTNVQQGTQGPAGEVDPGPQGRAAVQQPAAPGSPPGGLDRQGVQS